MILVTGATGKLGGNVVRALRSMGQPVRALVRKGSRYFWLNDSGCTYFFGDLTDPDTIFRAVSGVDYLIACSGVEHETKADNHTTVTVDGHQNLWDAAVARGVEHIVYISAMGVDRDYPVPWFQAKFTAEQSLIDSGLNHTILRPTPFTSTFAQMAFKAAEKGKVIMPGAGENIVAPIAPKDLALIAISCLDLEMAHNETLEVGGPEAMTAEEALRRAIEVYGQGGDVMALSSVVTQGVAKLVRVLGKRWENKVKHRATWFSNEFVTEMGSITDATGFELTGFDEALADDFAEIERLADPTARDERVVHRKFDATVYTPGEVDYDSLPSGPLRYED